MAAIDQRAVSLMQQWLQDNVKDNDLSDPALYKRFLDLSASLVEKYGTAAGSLACEIYDELAMAQGVAVKSAEMAEIPTYGEVAKAVNGAKKQSLSQVPRAVGRLVKQVGADTTLHNAMRDGAQFAWIPAGDTCAFCLTLASRGWQYMSKKALKNGHAEHIHANCDCQYAVRFDGKSTVAGYDPDKYLKMYESAEGSTPSEKIRYMRRNIKEEKNKKHSIKDITEQFLHNSTPGKGEVSHEEKADLKDIKTATWLFEKVGGNIRCLQEQSEKGKMPDSIREGIYFEFKAPTTKNAIDDRIRKATKQLYETLERDNNQSAQRGIVLDITENELSQDEALAEIERICVKRCKGENFVIVKKGNELIKIFKTK